MALKAYYTDAEAEAVKEHLASDSAKALGVEFKKDAEGRNILAVEARDGFALEHITGLRSSVEKAREERDAAVARIKALGDINPADIPKLVEKAKKFDSIDPEAAIGKAKTQYEEWKAEFTQQVAAEHQQAMDALAKQRDALQSQLARELIESRAMQVLSRPTVKGNSDLILPVIRNMTDAVLGEDGTMTVRVLNPLKPGQARIGKSGEPMDLEELIQDEIRVDPRYAPAFGGTGRSGGGEGEGAGSVGAGRRSQMTDKQKALFIRENGREAYRALPD